MKIRNSLGRIFTLILTLFFFGSNCVLAQTLETNFWKERQLQLASIPPSLQLPPITQTSLSSLGSTKNLSLLNTAKPNRRHFIDRIPANLGTIRKNSPIRSNSSKFVLHIQDIHQNAEAQLNISQVITQMVREESVDLVAVEGAFSSFDPRPFRRYPYPGSIKRAADALLDQQILSASMHSFYQSETKVPFIGVDDEKFYTANVAAYKKAAPRQKEIRSELKNEANDLQLQRQTIFNSALLSFDKAVQQFRENKMEHGDFVQELVLNEPSLTPQIQLFLDVLQIEKNLDFDVVQKERTLLLSKLSSSLNSEQLTHLLNMSVTYRIGHLSHVDFYRQLRTLCGTVGLHLEDLPHLKRYIHYLSLSDKISGESLFQEMIEKEKRIYHSLTRSKEEENLIAQSNALYLTQKLVDFSLTKQEWDQFKSLPLNAKRDLSNFIDFYIQAERRDAAMANNLLAAMKAHNAKRVILVSGGFHSKGIATLLNEKEIPTITFIPRLTEIDPDKGTEYLSLFSQEKTPLEELFEGTKLFLSPLTNTPGQQLGVVMAAMGDTALSGAPIAEAALRNSFPNLPLTTELERSGSEAIVTTHHHDTNKSIGATMRENADGSLFVQFRKEISWSFSLVLGVAWLASLVPTFSTPLVMQLWIGFFFAFSIAVSLFGTSAIPAGARMPWLQHIYDEEAELMAYDEWNIPSAFSPSFIESFLIRGGVFFFLLMLTNQSFQFSAFTISLFISVQVLFHLLHLNWHEVRSKSIWTVVKESWHHLFSFDVFFLTTLTTVGVILANLLGPTGLLFIVAVLLIYFISHFITDSLFYNNPNPKRHALLSYGLGGTGQLDPIGSKVAAAFTSKILMAVTTQPGQDDSFRSPSGSIYTVETTLTQVTQTPEIIRMGEEYTNKILDELNGLREKTDLPAISIDDNVMSSLIADVFRILQDEVNGDVTVELHAFISEGHIELEFVFGSLPPTNSARLRAEKIRQTAWTLHQDRSPSDPSRLRFSLPLTLVEEEPSAGSTLLESLRGLKESGESGELESQLKTAQARLSNSSRSFRTIDLLGLIEFESPELIALATKTILERDQEEALKAAYLLLRGIYENTSGDFSIESRRVARWYLSHYFFSNDSKEYARETLGGYLPINKLDGHIIGSNYYIEVLDDPLNEKFTYQLSLPKSIHSKIIWFFVRNIKARRWLIKNNWVDTYPGANMDFTLTDNNPEILEPAQLQNLKLSTQDIWIEDKSKEIILYQAVFHNWSYFVADTGVSIETSSRFSRWTTEFYDDTGFVKRSENRDAGIEVYFKKDDAEAPNTAASSIQTTGKSPTTLAQFISFLFSAPEESLHIIGSGYGSVVPIDWAETASKWNDFASEVKVGQKANRGQEIWQLIFPFLIWSYLSFSLVINLFIPSLAFLSPGLWMVQLFTVSIAVTQLIAMGAIASTGSVTKNRRGLLVTFVSLAVWSTAALLTLTPLPFSATMLLQIFGSIMFIFHVLQFMIDVASYDPTNDDSSIQSDIYAAINLLKNGKKSKKTRRRKIVLVDSTREGRRALEKVSGHSPIPHVIRFFTGLIGRVFQSLAVSKASNEILGQIIASGETSDTLSPHLSEVAQWVANDTRRSRSLENWAQAAHNYGDYLLYADRVQAMNEKAGDPFLGAFVQDLDGTRWDREAIVPYFSVEGWAAYNDRFYDDASDLHPQILLRSGIEGYLITANALNPDPLSIREFYRRIGKPEVAETVIQALKEGRGHEIILLDSWALAWQEGNDDDFGNLEAFREEYFSEDATLHRRIARERQLPAVTRARLIQQFRGQKELSRTERSYLNWVLWSHLEKGIPLSKLTRQKYKKVPQYILRVLDSQYFEIEKEFPTTSSKFSGLITLGALMRWLRGNQEENSLDDYDYGDNLIPEFPGMEIENDPPEPKPGKPPPKVQETPIKKTYPTGGEPTYPVEARQPKPVKAPKPKIADNRFQPVQPNLAPGADIPVQPNRFQQPVQPAEPQVPKANRQAPNQNRVVELLMRIDAAMPAGESTEGNRIVADGSSIGYRFGSNGTRLIHQIGSQAPHQTADPNHIAASARASQENPNDVGQNPISAALPQPIFGTDGAREPGNSNEPASFLPPGDATALKALTRTADSRSIQTTSQNGASQSQTERVDIPEGRQQSDQLVREFTLQNQLGGSARQISLSTPRPLRFLVLRVASLFFTLQLAFIAGGAAIGFLTQAALGLNIFIGLNSILTLFFLSGLILNLLAQRAPRFVHSIPLLRFLSQFVVVQNRLIQTLANQPLPFAGPQFRRTPITKIFVDNLVLPQSTPRFANQQRPAEPRLLPVQIVLSQYGHPSLGQGTVLPIQPFLNLRDQLISVAGRTGQTPNEILDDLVRSRLNRQFNHFRLRQALSRFKSSLRNNPFDEETNKEDAVLADSIFDTLVQINEAALTLNEASIRELLVVDKEGSLSPAVQYLILLRLMDELLGNAGASILDPTAPSTQAPDANDSNNVKPSTTWKIEIFEDELVEEDGDQTFNVEDANNTDGDGIVDPPAPISSSAEEEETAPTTQQSLTGQVDTILGGRLSGLLDTFLPDESASPLQGRADVGLPSILPAGQRNQTNTQVYPVPTSRIVNEKSSKSGGILSSIEKEVGSLITHPLVAPFFLTALVVSAAVGLSVAIATIAFSITAALPLAIISATVGFLSLLIYMVVLDSQAERASDSDAKIVDTRGNKDRTTPLDGKEINQLADAIFSAALQILDIRRVDESDLTTVLNSIVPDVVRLNAKQKTVLSKLAHLDDRQTRALARRLRTLVREQTGQSAITLNEGRQIVYWLVRTFGETKDLNQIVGGNHLILPIQGGSPAQRISEAKNAISLAKSMGAAAGSSQSLYLITAPDDYEFFGDIARGNPELNIRVISLENNHSLISNDGETRVLDMESLARGLEALYVKFGAKVLKQATVAIPDGVVVENTEFFDSTNLSWYLDQVQWVLLKRLEDALGGIQLERDELNSIEAVAQALTHA